MNRVNQRIEGERRVAPLPQGGRFRRAGRRLLGAAVLLAVTACDLTVSNPGPVNDEYLDNPLAYDALANAVGFHFLSAFNQVTYTQMVVAREVHFAGQTGAHGFAFDMHLGVLKPEDTNGHWENANRARWVAEDAVARMREGLGSEYESSPEAAHAELWRGYIYRLLGENWCHAVIEGGAPQDASLYHEKAEEAFSAALEIASRAGESEVATAARAARASTRVWRGNWEGAVADAALIPTDFVFTIRTSSLHDDQHNRVYWGSSNNPWRAHSVWNTFYEDYYLETGDPRVSWSQDPAVPNGNAAVTGIGQVPWYFQTKYTARDEEYPLSHGAEMRLIEAEALLRQGQWQSAMAIINELRQRQVSDIDGAPLAPLVASSAEEAWTHLKRERGIVLWLEGRRLGDLRRWIEGDTPGAADDMADRSLCFPIPTNERERNPNIPVDFPEAPRG